MDEPTYRILTGMAVSAVVFSVCLWFDLRRPSRSNVAAAIPGPPSPSWIFGNMSQLLLAENYGDHEFQWQKQYGSVYRIRGCFGEDRLVVSDPQALRHLLNEPSITRPPALSNIHRLLLHEESIFCVEGQEHKRLRAAMSAAFSGRGVRNFLPVFVDIAKKMVHEWDRMCLPGSSAHLNVSEMLDHATLDIICDAVLGFPANTVQNPGHPLVPNHLHVIESAFIRSKAALIAEFLTAYMPAFVLRLVLHLPVGPLPAVLKFKTVTNQSMEEKAQSLQRDDSENHDLLSAMFSSSSKTGVTHSQIAHQIPFLLLAGQGTSATVLSWAFYWLAQNSEFQRNLRQEILSNSKEGRLDYDNMPLLNALLKETLRMFPASPLLERWAGEDFVLPLSSEIVTSTGKHICELPIRKGQHIYLALGAYQRLEALWGSDADEFKPSRWFEGEPCTVQALGPYAQLAAFWGGPHVCAGWRFAILEMQVILAQVLGKFSFSVPEDSIVRSRLAATHFPVDGEGVKGLWLSVECFAT